MNYYIALKDDGKRTLVAGPYRTEQEAQDNRAAAIDWACKVNKRYHFAQSCLAKTEGIYKTAALRAIEQKIKLKFTAASNIASA